MMLSFGDMAAELKKTLEQLAERTPGPAQRYPGGRGLDFRALAQARARLAELECRRAAGTVPALVEELLVEELREEYVFWARVVKFIAVERDLAGFQRDLETVARASDAYAALKRLTLPIWKLAQLHRLDLDPGDPTLRRLLRTFHPGLSEAASRAVATAMAAAAPEIEARLPGFLPHG